LQAQKLFTKALFSNSKSNMKGSNSPVLKSNLFSSEKDNRVQLCVWGSTKMDGQKRIWLQQAELLNQVYIFFSSLYILYLRF
jgi:hypothetical protein